MDVQRRLALECSINVTGELTVKFCKFGSVANSPRSGGVSVKIKGVYENKMSN